LVVIAVSIAAAVISMATGIFGDPASLAIVGPILAAIIITRVPKMAERMSVVVPLLLMGWFSGAAGLMFIDPRAAETWAMSAAAALLIGSITLLSISAAQPLDGKES
jgi:hypothetical protein